MAEGVRVRASAKAPAVVKQAATPPAVRRKSRRVLRGSSRFMGVPPANPRLPALPRRIAGICELPPANRDDQARGPQRKPSTEVSRRIHRFTDLRESRRGFSTVTPGKDPVASTFKERGAAKGSGNDFRIGLSRNDWSWIGRGGCVFFLESFVVHSIRVSTMGLQSARASLSPRLAEESATPSLSSQLNRSGQAACSPPITNGPTRPHRVWRGRGIGLAPEHLQVTLKALIRKLFVRTSQGLSPQILAWMRGFQ